MHTLISFAPTDPAVPQQPGLRPGLTEDQVTPGLLGFLVTFFIVVVMVFLIRDMVKRVRRVRYRQQVEGTEQEAPEHMGIPLMSESAMQAASYTFEDDFASPPNPKVAAAPSPAGAAEDNPSAPGSDPSGTDAPGASASGSK